MVKPFDFVDAIGYTKRDLIRESADPESTAKAYDPWLMNRHLSYFADAVFYSNDMNLLSGLDRLMQHDYMISTLRARKRFSKWHKPAGDELLDLISVRYGVNRAKASAILKTLSREDAEAATKRLRAGDGRDEGIRGGKTP